MQIVEFLIPENEWMSSNGRYQRFKKHRLTQMLRERGKLIGQSMIRLGQLTPITGPVKVTAVIQYAGGRPDPNNANPTTKALIDGLTDAGLWPDDNWKWITGPDHRRMPGRAPKGQHRVRLSIEPIEPEEELKEA